jgi:hypothetical protein
MRKRSMVGVIALLLLALAPLSASAASSSTQTFTGTVDINAIAGSCPTADVDDGDNQVAGASGVVSDTGEFSLYLTSSGPFPNQVEGEFTFTGAHSSAEIDFTGALRCPTPQSFLLNGAVWHGELYDDATGKWYSMNGAGRGNVLTLALGPNGFSVTFTGTAKPSQAPLQPF